MVPKSISESRTRVRLVSVPSSVPGTGTGTVPCQIGMARGMPAGMPRANFSPPCQLGTDTKMIQEA